MNKLASCLLFLFLTGCTSTRDSTIYYDPSQATPVSLDYAEQVNTVDEDNAITQMNEAQEMQAAAKEYHDETVIVTEQTEVIANH